MAIIRMPSVRFLLTQLLFMVSLPWLGQASTVKGGYWVGEVPATSINFNFQTHIWYAFAGLDNASFAVTAPTDSQFPSFTSIALQSNPSIQTLLSIGGGASSPADFATMASAPATRKVFIDSSISLARQYGFNGLDLDWEYPGSQTEMDNLGLLFGEWRAAVTVESQSSGKANLLLTAAVNYQSILLYSGDGNQIYPITSINNNLDWLNLMCYDYHGSWEPSMTGEHTALYDPTSNLDTDYGITNWLNAGLDPAKLCMGLAYYGISWKLVSLASTFVGAPTTSASAVYMYKDIVTFNGGGATNVQDSATVSMYSFQADLTWIGYDDPSTITSKVQYANGKSLLGYFAWALHQDDSQWSLATAAFNALSLEAGAYRQR